MAIRTEVQSLLHCRLQSSRLEAPGEELGCTLLLKGSSWAVGASSKIVVMQRRVRAAVVQANNRSTLQTSQYVVHVTCLPQLAIMRPTLRLAAEHAACCKTWWKPPADSTIGGIKPKLLCSAMRP